VKPPTASGEIAKTLRRHFHHTPIPSPAASLILAPRPVQYDRRQSLRLDMVYSVSLKAAAVVAILIAAGPASAAVTCLSPAEVRASAVRQLQTELMVATLSCAKHPSASLTDRYNAFVRKFGKDLAANADVLRAYFARAYGKGQAKQFDAYITALANEASQRSMGQDQLCESMPPVFDKILGIDAKQLETFAAANVELGGKMVACAKQ
jgi:hypothetical protein